MSSPRILYVRGAQVVWGKDRDPTEDEIAEMEELLEEQRRDRHTDMWEDA